MVIYLYDKNKLYDDYHQIHNTSIDMCKLFERTAGSRLFQEYIEKFNRRLNRPFMCPLKSGFYKLQNFKTDDIALPPLFLPLVNSNGRLEIRFFSKEKNGLEFVALSRFDTMVSNKKIKW